MRGKCPKCEKMITRVNLDDVPVNTGIGGTTWAGVTYLCPFCRTVLGVSIDPVALKTDIVNEIKAALKRL